MASFKHKTLPLAVENLGKGGYSHVVTRIFKIILKEDNLGKIQMQVQIQSSKG